MEMPDLNVEGEYHNHVLPMLEYWSNDPKIQYQEVCFKSKVKNVISHVLLCMPHYQLDNDHITQRPHQ